MLLPGSTGLTGTGQRRIILVINLKLRVKRSLSVSLSAGTRPVGFKCLNPASAKTHLITGLLVLENVTGTGYSLGALKEMFLSYRFVK